MNKHQLLQHTTLIVNEMVTFLARINAVGEVLTLELSNEYFSLKRRANALEREILSAEEDPEIVRAYCHFRQKFNKFQHCNHKMLSFLEGFPTDKCRKTDRR